MEFDWDDGNRGKNLRHGVHDWEIEEALGDVHRVRVGIAYEHGERREVILGRARTSGKYLRVVYTRRGRSEDDLYRPISAVEMNASQRRRYQRGRR